MDNVFLIATSIAVFVLTLAHIFVGKLRFLNKNPDVWKSAGGGVGIAYVFLILLPKLASAQDALRQTNVSGLYGFLVQHSYLVALIGLVVYYGMDAAVERVLMLPDNRVVRPGVRLLVLVHASSLLGYYFLVSYLMTERPDRGAVSYVSLGLFVAAMLLHIVPLDGGIRRKFGGLYDRYIRWAFAAASIGGWSLAAWTEIPFTTLALLNSLFAGALLVFTLKEKTPGSDCVHFGPFLAGVTGYSALLLLMEFLNLDTP